MATGTVKIAKLRQWPSGRIQAKSSDGRTIYEVSVDPPSCTCMAGQRGMRCYHVKTAQERYANPETWFGA